MCRRKIVINIKWLVLRDRLKFVFSPDIILSGWLGSRHRLNNWRDLYWTTNGQCYAPHQPNKVTPIYPAPAPLPKLSFVMAGEVGSGGGHNVQRLKGAQKRRHALSQKCPKRANRCLTVLQISTQLKYSFFYLLRFLAPEGACCHVCSSLPRESTKRFARDVAYICVTQRHVGLVHDVTATDCQAQSGSAMF